MVPITVEKRMLDNGESSSAIEPPNSKRHRVSAVRSFPPGCGPDTSHSDVINNQTLNCSDDVTNAEHLADGNETVPLIAQRPKLEDGESLSVIGPVKDREIGPPKDGHADDGSVNMRSDHLPGELVPSSCNSSETLQGHTDYANGDLLDEIQEPSKDLMQAVAQKSVVQDRTESLEAEDGIWNFSMEEQMIVEDKSDQHHPIPSIIAQKARKCLPRRSVSAVRGIPPGCESNTPHSNKCFQADVPAENRSRVEDEAGSERNKADTKTEVKEIGDHGEGDIVHQMSEDAHGSQYDAEVQPKPYADDIKGSAMQSVEVQLLQSCDGQVGMSKLQSTQGVQFEQLELAHERMEKGASEGGDTEKATDFAKDNVGRDDSATSPGSSFCTETGTMTDSNHEERLVVVLGISAAVNCSWQQKKTKTRSSSVGARRSKRRRCVAGKQLELHDAALARASDVGLPLSEGSFSTITSARSRVREVLRLFQVVHRKLLQEEETKLKKTKQRSGRIDQQALKILREKDKCINMGKEIFGPVPGVEVGDEFHYRVELMLVGLHRPSRSIIDYGMIDGKIFAISIVASGGYDNSLDCYDVFVYEGQGGHSAGGDKVPEDQKLERGNLALKNSIDQRNLVRVIQGVKETKIFETCEAKAKVSATYTYFGLYTVNRYWQDFGKRGSKIYKFELKRVPGQPELAWKEVKKSEESKFREGCCVNDISEGKERFPVCAINTIDDEKPPPFTYITSMIYPDWCNPIPPQGCDCKKGCSDSKQCPCVVKNGGEIPYNHEGAIVEAKPLVFECGPSCKCSASCQNRVSQNGFKFRLEIFKTESRGWGVRSLSSIPSGSFICEYIGELLDDKEAEQRTGNDEYLFDIGRNYKNQSLWEGLSNLMPDAQSSSSEGVVPNVGFTIDAAQYGNVGRFINHSCSPNLYAQDVLYDHDDIRIPHVMLFAAENIPPLQELTYDYNYKIGEVRDKDGNIKMKNCYCGSSECTGRMY